MNLPEIPQGWLIAIMFAGLILLRILSIDSWTTASLSLIIGYMTGKHIEQRGHTDPVEAAKVLATSKLTATALEANK